jgi:hypothetical protein
MPNQFPTDEALRRLSRLRLFRAQQRYGACPTMENLAAVRRALAIFRETRSAWRKAEVCSRFTDARRVEFRVIGAG